MSKDYRGQRNFNSSKNNNLHLRDPRHNTGASQQSKPRRPFYAEKCDSDGNYLVQNESGAKLFLRSVVEHDREEEILDSLATETGKKALKSAIHELNYKDHESCQFLIDFIALLGRENLTVGLKKMNLVSVTTEMVSCVGFTSVLESIIKANVRLNVLPIAWLASFVAINRNDKKQLLLNLADAVMPKLTNAAAQQELKNVFGPASNDLAKNTSLSMDELKNFEPLHDNDKMEDFREIQILPTVAEINCNYPISHVPGCWLDDQQPPTERGLIERQFRLLREDMLAPLRDELQKILNSKETDFTKQKLFKPVAFEIDTSTSAYVNVAFDPTPSLEKKLANLKPKELKKFFEDDAHRLLARESLLLFVDNDSKRVILIGLIASRDPKQMEQVWTEHQKLCAGVYFPENTLKSILLKMHPLSEASGQPLSSFVIQSKVSYFAYEPVLKCLKSQAQVYLKEEILSTNPAVTASKVKIEVPVDIQEKLRSDPSQLQAVEYALSRRVSLIQGPPGTGKTYVGVKLIETLLRDPSSKILCICYTNHALDSFLESLLKETIPIKMIVRFGNYSKVSDAIKECCFQNLNAGDFNKSQKRRNFLLQESLRNLSQEIQESMEKITDRGTFTNNSWRSIKEFFDNSEKYSSLLDQFKIPISTLTGGTIVGKNNKPLKDDEYFRTWIGGNEKPALLNLDHVPIEKNLWFINKTHRKDLLRKWWEEWIQEDINNLVEQMLDYTQKKKELMNLREEHKSTLLSSKRILACTTTFAAKNRDLIDSCCPNVLLVEEAAEIHESHILTNLTRNIERLIMIGDHKQLRPKLEYYPLRVESGKKIDFDVSLFERLVKIGYESAQLKIQHRMRPSISGLIKATYPDLQDHERVKDRENIRGMYKNVAFINHQYPENTESDAFLNDLNSKSNGFEANMIIRVAIYLLQQGYKPEDIVILTPYLGQLMKIRNLMRDTKELNAELSELDLNDLPDSDEDSSNPNEPLRKRNIRVATIDNFQGEESKIILASLVRSNSNGDIGFTGGAERVNVLCSRAKDGFYLFGNKDTFFNAKASGGRETWQQVIIKLEERDCIIDGFPIMCQNHKKRQIIKTPEEFFTISPFGGCQEICNEIIPTCQQQDKHRCPKNCHPVILFGKNTHEQPPCHFEVIRNCSNNHTLQKKCYEASFPTCTAKIFTRCTNGHNVPHECSKLPPECKKCKKLKEEQEKKYKEIEDTKAVMEQTTIELQKQQIEVNMELLKQKEKLNVQFQHELIQEDIAEGKNQIKLIQEQNERKKTKPVLSTEMKHKNQPVKLTAALESKPMIEDVPTLDVSTSLVSPTSMEVMTSLADTKQRNENSLSEKLTSPSSSGIINNGSNPTPLPGPPISANSTPPRPNNSGSDEKIGNTFSQIKKNSVIDGRLSEDKNQSTSTQTEPLKNEDKNLPSNARNLNLPMTEKLKIQKIIEEERWLDAISFIESQKPHLKLKEIFHYSQDFEWMLFLLLVYSYLGEERELLMSRLREIGLFMNDSSFPRVTIEQNLLFRYVSLVLCSLSNQTTNLAVRHAKLFLDIASSIPNYSLPKLWISKAQEARNLLNQKQNVAASNTLQEESSVKERWNHMKNIGSLPNKSNPPSESMECLLKMIGLNKVKESFLQLYQKVVIAKNEQKVSLDGNNFNTLFLGNPGTGKTSVASLFSSFLTEIGLFEFEAKIIIKTGSELTNDGVDGLESILKDLQKDGGGVIFVDEAYQLNDPAGRPIIDYILGNSERMKGKYGKLVWILAGYKKQMEDFLKVNPGLPSRFPETFHFEDYSDEELESILKGFFDRGGQDITMKQPAKKKKENKASMPINNNNNLPNPMLNNYFIGSANVFTPNIYLNRPDRTDKWENLWKWDNQRATYYDEYGNISGYGPRDRNYPLGSNANPIVSTKTNIIWIYNDSKKHWYDQSDPGHITTNYPGKLAEENASPTPIHPFVISNSKWIRIAARRVGRGRDVEGFGNARSIRTLFQRSHTRQIQRIINLRMQGYNPNLYMFERNDLLGPKASLTNLQSSKAWYELKSLEGLEEVKESLSLLLDTVITNADREEEEKKPLELVLNTVFLGNPGTGKTTVAKLYGQILADLGMLSKGEMVLKTASDFIGSVLGKSEEITKGILEQSKGCVLVIDEAYGLYQSTNSNGKGQNEPFREAVINTLVEQIQGKPGDDRAVILIGYRQEMEIMFKNANPGLSRRFQLEKAFQFNDYSDESLIRILKKTVEKEELKISTETAIFAIQQLAKARARPNFGNAGAVNNLLSGAKLSMQKRIKDYNNGMIHPIDKDLLEKDDFKAKDYQENALSPKMLLKDLVGCTEIQKKLESYCNKVEYFKAKGKNPKTAANFNYLFVGNPGTGKTTIARLMGKMFHSLGLIPFSEVIETTPAKFQTGYVGQAATKTEEIFKDAKGRVLFIDEAYQLNPEHGGRYMKEVVDQMVQCLTSKEFKNELILILAGYEEDIHEMLKVNQGLQSRFTETFTFHDLSMEEIIEMIPKKLENEDETKWNEEAEDYLPIIANELKQIEGFSNGRDIETFIKKVIDKKIDRYCCDNNEEILKEDLMEALQAMKQDRKQKKPFTKQGGEGGGAKNEYFNNPLINSTADDCNIPPPIPTFTFSTAPAVQSSRIKDNKIKNKDTKMKKEDGFDDSDWQDISKEMNDSRCEVLPDMDEKEWEDLLPFIPSLQKVLDENDWNNPDIIKILSQSADGNHPYQEQLIHQLATLLNKPIQQIEKFFHKWQKNQQKISKLQELQKKKQMANQTNQKTLVPIWRCAVCGRADQPYIACYVSPFIVRYEERNLS